jgi:hypothetical protein
MQLYERIALENGLVLEIWDESRKIAADTVKVTLAARIKVDVKEEYFTSPEHYRTVLQVFGPAITFEQKKERTFVDIAQRDIVFTSLLNEFKESALKYISNPKFPSGFVISKLADVQKNPYKYRGAGGNTDIN